MKRISFLVLVFMLTTGFFKSALEECADILSREDSRFNQTQKFKKVELTNHEKIKVKRDLERDRQECIKSKKSNPDSITTTVSCMIYKANRGTISTKWKNVKVGDISKRENQKLYKKFISQSLKKKMNDIEFEKTYLYCVNYKKNYPEMFKAKYD